jgi:hypothetical protein
MLSVLLTNLALVGCAQIQAYQTIEQSFDKELYTTIGGVVLKVRKTRDLPNVFGRADVWGGKVDEGFIELRYQNLNEDGTISFTMTDVSILTDEDVFSRYLGGNKKTITLQTFSNPYANTSTTTGVISDRQRKEATRQLLPPNVREFRFDYKNNPALIVADTQIKILDASPVNLRYALMPIRK